MPDGTESPFEQQIREEAALSVPNTPEEPLQPQFKPESAIPAEQKKILGMFDTEDQLATVLETLVKEREAQAQEVNRLRALQPPEPVNQASLEKKAFVERQNFLYQKASEAKQQGRLDDATEITAQIIQEASDYRRGGTPEDIIQQRVEAELNKRLGPIASLKQFESAPNIQHLKDFAPDAVRMQMAGFPEEYIVDVLNKAYSAGQQSISQKLAEQRGYTEPVEVFRTAQDKQEFDNNSKRAWEKILGSNTQKYTY